jgi:RNA polymerase sigma factor (sigma-70 family)
METGTALSPRERQILTLVNGGKTRKEVAYDLGVTHSTVRVLYSRAMKKLSGRWQAPR